MHTACAAIPKEYVNSNKQTITSHPEQITDQLENKKMYIGIQIFGGMSHLLFGKGSTAGSPPQNDYPTSQNKKIDKKLFIANQIFAKTKPSVEEVANNNLIFVQTGRSSFKVTLIQSINNGPCPRFHHTMAYDTKN